MNDATPKWKLTPVAAREATRLTAFDSAVAQTHRQTAPRMAVGQPTILTQFRDGRPVTFSVWFWIGLLKFLIPTVLIKDIRKTEKERLHQTNVRLNLELLRAVFQ